MLFLPGNLGKLKTAGSLFIVILSQCKQIMCHILSPFVVVGYLRHVKFKRWGSRQAINDTVSDNFSPQCILVNPELTGCLHFFPLISLQ
jgi:hypothetical protein